METAIIAVQLISKLSALAEQAYIAEQAGDQATLDALKVKVVAASNAMAPVGGVAPVAVS